jgi:hypothetical protein
MNKYLKVLGVFAIATVLFSCEKDEDVDAIVNVAKPNMTIDMATAISAQEGEEVPFTLNFDQPVGRDFTFFVVRLNESTASADDSSVNESYPNNAFQQSFTVPAGSLTFTDKIVINNDDDNDPNEILVLSMGDTRTSAVIFTPKVVTINIANVVSDELELEFFYDRTFGEQNQFSLCALNNPALPTTPVNLRPYDIDFILLDSDGVDTGNIDGQTAACDEKISMNLNDLADGTYFVIANLWTNASINLNTSSYPQPGLAPFNIPISVKYTRAGSFKGTYAQDAADYLKSVDPRLTEKYVLSVDIFTDTDGLRKFKVYNSDNGVISGTGKYSKSAISNKRR